MKPIAPASIILFFLCISIFSNAHAEKTSAELANEVIRSTEEFPKVEELNWLNQKFLTKQRSTVEEITRTRFGRGLSGNKQDLRLLQRIVNEKAIDPTETEVLQALGVVLGDAYVNDTKELEWKIFTDEIGSTHAVCVKNTKECIFVLTMLSRRMEVGLSPDVDALYQKGLNAMKNVLPKVPYAVD